METRIPAKLLALGVLLMAMAAFAVACGGDTLEFTVLTPTPIPQPAAAATTAPGPTTASVIVPTIEPATAPVLAVTPEPATQVIPPTSEPTTQVITPTPEPPTPEPPTPTGSPEGRPIELRLIIMKRAPDNTVTVLEEDGVLTADDYYGIFFQPPAESWVYILQQDSIGAISVLFPNPDFSDQTNPLPGGTPVWIPKDYNNWFFLDETVGRESFFVVASKERNVELESMLAGDRTKEVLGPLARLLGEGERDLGGVKKFREEPKLLPDGNSVLLEEQLLQGKGDNFVYVLGFEHK